MDLQTIGRALAGFGAGVQGNGVQFLQGMREQDANANLMKLGQSLANGDIDQTQYLKGIAQYSPELYGKMQLTRMSNQAPAALQNFEKVQALKAAGDSALQQGDRNVAQQFYNQANNLMSIIRGPAYGVDTFQLPPATQPAPVQPGATQPINPTDTFVSASEPAPTGVNPIAQQLAANAAAKKGAETQAQKNVELNMNPQITEADKRAEQNVIKETAADIEAEKKKGAGDITPVQKKESGQENISTVIDKMLEEYGKLDKMGAIVSTKRKPLENLAISVRTSGMGQALGQKIGAEEQTIRDNVKNAIPRLMTSIKNATGMSAQEVNSIPEMQLLKESVSSPTQSIETVTDTLATLKSLYGSKKTEKTEKTENKTSTFKEGQIATNPKTGEKIIFKEGKWQSQ